MRGVLEVVLLAASAPPACAWYATGASPRAYRALSSVPHLEMGAKMTRVAIVGGGTVGGGIVEILGAKADFAQKELGADIQIVKVGVRDATKPRDFEVPAGCEVTDDIESILTDDSLDLVVEVMGGTTLAKDVVLRSLKAGKHVVTANKALIAQDLAEIAGTLASVNAERDDPVQFGYEAAVCGGIPIIHALQRDFLGDDVSQLSGIINGCTNFMLSGMEAGDQSYADALKASTLDPECTMNRVCWW